MPISRRGFLYGFSEMGSEGVHWMLRDPALPGHDGLYSVNAGQHLRVLDEDGKLAWSGIIAPAKGDNCWIEGKGGVCWLQRGEIPAAWTSLFDRELRAEIVDVVSGNIHPLLASADIIDGVIRSLPAARALELFSSSLYRILSWYANGWRSIGKDIGFELEDILLLLGSPSSETIREWQRYPRRANETGLPYSPELLARLCGMNRVIGGACMLHGHKAERLGWGHLKTDGASPFDRMLAGDRSLWTLVAEVEQAVAALWAGVPTGEYPINQPFQDTISQTSQGLPLMDALQALAGMLDIRISAQAVDEAARGHPSRALREMADASAVWTPEQ